MVGQEYVLNIFGAFWSTDWGMKILSLPSNLGASSFFFFFMVISTVTASYTGAKAFFTSFLPIKCVRGMGPRLPRTPIPSEMIYTAAALTSRVWSYRSYFSGLVNCLLKAKDSHFAPPCALASGRLQNATEIRLFCRPDLKSLKIQATALSLHRSLVARNFLHFVIDLLLPSNKMSNDFPHFWHSNASLLNLWNR